MKEKKQRIANLSADVRTVSNQLIENAVEISSFDGGVDKGTGFNSALSQATDKESIFMEINNLQETNNIFRSKTETLLHILDEQPFNYETREPATSNIDHTTSYQNIESKSTPEQVE